MREMIDHYTVDKETAPQSLEDLSQAGYLHESSSGSRYPYQGMGTKV